MRTDRSAFSAALVALLTTASGAATSGAPDESEAAIAARFRSLYPKTTFTEIRKAPVDGLYEVVMGQNVAYTDKSGRYFIFGNLWDMRQQADLTPRPQPVERHIEFPAEHLEQAIKTMRGDGSRRMAVFSDPDCPHCRTLEAELDRLDNVTVYTFMYPLAALHPGAAAKAESVWCSPDRAKAWKEAVVEGRSPQAVPCDNPVQANIELGARLGLTGTPTLIAADGRVITGAAPAARIDAWLDRHMEEKP